MTDQTNPLTPKQADREAANAIRDMTQRGLEAQGFKVSRKAVADDDELTFAFAHHAQQARLEEREPWLPIVRDLVNLIGEVAPEYAASAVVANAEVAIRKGEAA